MVGVPAGRGAGRKGVTDVWRSVLGVWRSVIGVWRGVVGGGRAVVAVWGEVGKVRKRVEEGEKVW
jgi:hypothetical protein